MRTHTTVQSNTHTLFFSETPTASATLVAQVVALAVGIIHKIAKNTYCIFHFEGDGLGL
jgi:hypothetical protein